MRCITFITTMIKANKSAAVFHCKYSFTTFPRTDTIISNDAVIRTASLHQCTLIRPYICLQSQIIPTAKASPAIIEVVRTAHAVLDS